MYGRYVGMYCTVAVNVKRYICVSNKNTAWRDVWDNTNTWRQLGPRGIDK